MFVYTHFPVCLWPHTPITHIYLLAIWSKYTVDTAKAILMKTFRGGHVGIDERDRHRALDRDLCKSRCVLTQTHAAGVTSPVQSP